MSTQAKPTPLCYLMCVLRHLAEAVPFRFVTAWAVGRLGKKHIPPLLHPSGARLLAGDPGSR